MSALLLTSLISLGGAARVQPGRAQVTPQRFVLPLQLPGTAVGPQRSLKGQLRVRFTFAGIPAQQHHRSFRQGPISDYWVTASASQTAITLRLRPGSGLRSADIRWAKQSSAIVAQVALPAAPVVEVSEVTPAVAELPVSAITPAPEPQWYNAMQPKPAKGGTMVLWLIVAGVAALCFVWMRKRRSDDFDDDLTIVSTRALTKEHRLTLVEANGQRMLLATSSAGVQFLSTPSAAVFTPAARFADALEQVDLEELDTELADPEITAELKDNDDIAGLIRLRDRLSKRQALPKQAAGLRDAGMM